MPKLKTLLLHPQPETRALLRALLAPASFLQVLGEAVSGFEAMELMERIDYGAVFLGCELEGDVSGFELAQMIQGRKPRPALVFVAPDESFAYKGFELGATDYLIEPLDKGRVTMTLERLKLFKSQFGVIEEPENWSHGEDTPDRTVQLPLEEEEQEDFLQALKHAWDQGRLRTPEIEKLPVNAQGKTILIPYESIIFVEAYEDYSYVHTSDQKFLTSHRLKNLEDRLSPHRFFRVHRKYLVNLDMVTEIASLPGSNFMLRTAGKTRIELPVSRRRIAQLKQILGL